MRGKFFLVVLILSALCFLPLLWAAACEPDIGEWSHFKKSPTPLELSEVNRVHFGPARIVTAARGIDSGRFNSNAISGVYTARVIRKDGLWTFNFEKSNEWVGTLSLRLPKTWSFFQAQMESLDSTDDRSKMYKEIRLTGGFNGKGLFTSDNSPKSRYRLILQGAGGRCFEANDFSYWILQIEDSDSLNPSKVGVSYWFHGKLLHTS